MDRKFIREIRIDHAKIEHGSYLNGIKSIQSTKKITFAPLTFFVGENGSGKSTLLEAIAVGYGFNPEGGSKNFNFSTRDTHSELHKALTIVKGTVQAKDGFFLRAESFYNVASNIDDLADCEWRQKYFGGSLHQKSHGESFMALVQNRFLGNGLYILDEPEAALSPQRILSLIIFIRQLIDKNSQFIISSHSPILLGIPNAKILSFDDGKIAEISYEETSSYRITKSFLNNREQFIKNLSQ